MKHRRSLALITLTFSSGLWACSSTPAGGDADSPSSGSETARGQHDPPPREIEGEPIIQLLEHDDIPAIDEPRFVSVEEGDAFLDAGETVLGVVGRDGTARAYSAWHLDRHEIVNDVLDGEPITATW